MECTGITHPGLFGIVPSADLLPAGTPGERASIATEPVHLPTLGLLPLPGRRPGRYGHRQPARGIGRDGARTVAPRENGGNHDTENSTRGGRVLHPVYVDGALLSGEALHPGQEAGEIELCGAIEMGGMQTYGVTTNPIFNPGRVELRYPGFLAFIGVSVDHRDDTNAYMDATPAYRNACLNAVRYAEKRGYTGERAQLTSDTSPIEGRIGRVVDIPYARCSVLLPTEIFDEDIGPDGRGSQREDRGQVCVSS